MKVRTIVYEIFVVGLWAVALPSILIADAGNGITWRGNLGVVVAVLLLACGVVLIDRGARELSAGGIRLFGVRPGDRLVTSGIYARIRNPIDVGAIVVAASTWLALDLALVWVIPAAAIVSAVAGAGPYEDRLLLEVFGSAFADYRQAVPKWLPRSR